MNSAASGAAVAAAIAAAIKASGTIVRVEPLDFQSLINRQTEPLIVHSVTGVFTKYNQYLTSYKGLAFYTKSADELSMPRHAEVILAKSMWVPA